MPEKKIMGQVEKGWRALVFIWIAFLATLIIYFAVAFVLKDKVHPFTENFPLLRGALYLISGVSLFLAWYMRKVIIEKSRARAAAWNPAGGVSHPAIAAYTTAVAVSLAMSESIGVYGLVLRLFGGSILDLYSLMFLSAAAMIYYRPQKEELLKMMREPRTHDTY